MHKSLTNQTMRRNNFSIVYFFFFLLMACNKAVDELPTLTQNGANTFGAKVDGILWVPKGFGPFPASNLLEARFTTPTSILINARNFASSPNETGFEILVSGVTGPGTYALNTNVTLPAITGYGYYLKNRLTPQDEWLTTAEYTGTVTISRLDIANKIVAGTFQFNALSLYNTTHAIHVTDGRFDIKYK